MGRQSSPIAPFNFDQVDQVEEVQPKELNRAPFDGNADKETKFNLRKVAENTSIQRIEEPLFQEGGDPFRGSGAQDHNGIFGDEPFQKEGGDQEAPQQPIDPEAALGAAAATGESFLQARDANGALASHSNSFVGNSLRLKLFNSLRLND